MIASSHSGQRARKRKSKLQLRESFEKEFRPNRLRFKSPNTVYKYRLELSRFDLFLERPALLSDLNDTTVGDAAEWVLSTEKGLGLSVESTRGFLGRIRKIWEFLARRRLVDDFPTIENLRKQKKTPIAWEREQLDCLWQAVIRQPGSIAGIPAADWWGSLLLCMWRTGERIGAMRRVRPSDVDIKSGWLSVPPEHRKGGCQGRVYRLTPDSTSAVAKIWSIDRPLVWPWPYSYHFLWPRYKEILRCAGLPFGSERMFGCIRKSHASHLDAAGGDATESLGHASRQTTKDSYLDPRICRTDWPANRLFPLGE